MPSLCAAQSLSLASCADSQVGDEIVGGLSGGEKRRTNVGVELVTNPALLFLDGQQSARTPPHAFCRLSSPSLPAALRGLSEPTTGLDSHTALTMVRCLKRLTRVQSDDEEKQEAAH